MGGPGTGKTTLAASACKAGYRVHILDIDGKVAGAANLQDYIKKGQLTYETLESRLIVDDLRERAKATKANKQGDKEINLAPKKTPQGYFEIIEKINDLYENPKGDIVALDSFTRICSHLKRYQLHVTQRSHFEYSDWDAWAIQLDELVDSFLHVPCEHQIITFHNKIIRDELTGKVRVLPAIQGSFDCAVGAHFNEWHITQVEVDKQGQAKFTCMTKPDREKDARTSFAIPTFVESDLSKILPRKE